MVERSLSMREVPGSIPGASKGLFFLLFLFPCAQKMGYKYSTLYRRSLATAIPH
jgi:hypothetical protein